MMKEHRVGIDLTAGHRNSDAPKAFVAAERLAQADFFARTVGSGDIHPGCPYRLTSDARLKNLAPFVCNVAEQHFAGPRQIVWHRHTNHGLSSQVCCLNFLMPLSTQPRLLERIIAAALSLEAITVLPVSTHPGEPPQHIEFEWIGEANYLGEWPSGRKPTRGANVTSADAAIRFEHKGVIQTVLIEWKYTESYGQPLGEKGNVTRLGHYRNRFRAPYGPIDWRHEVQLDDFSWEPFYQMLRQQTLAWQMERARELGTQRVSVLHVALAGNASLHMVTSPGLRRFGVDVFSVFSSLLAEPDRFISRSTEQVFGPFLSMEHTDPSARAWTGYVNSRCTFMTKA